MLNSQAGLPSAGECGRTRRDPRVEARHRDLVAHHLKDLVQKDRPEYRRGSMAEE